MKTQIFFKLFVFFLIVIAAATLTLDLAVRQAWQRSLFPKHRRFPAARDGDAGEPREGRRSPGLRDDRE